MIFRTKITAEHYYDSTPTGAHLPGDIWSGLPTFGLLGSTHTSGVVITPACDLAQCKIETISYLPIIPITSLYSLHAALPSIRQIIDGQLRAIGFDGFFKWRNGYVTPNSTELDSLETLLIDQKRSNNKPNALISIGRIEAAITILRSIRAPENVMISADTLATAIGENEWAQLKSRLVSNHKQEFHFLPADGQPIEWTAVPNHSLVLFRYPLTAPIQIFDAAQDIALVDWENWCDIASVEFPAAVHFRKEKPLKRSRVKQDFLSDIVSRFASLYARIGSPDFTPETITAFCNQI